MREGLHPVYPPSRVTCACGNVVETRSTRGSFQVEVCSACHPFFTGKQKLMDTEGRVERFRKKYGEKATVAGNVAPAKEAKPAEAAKPEKASAPKAEKAAKKAKEPKEAKA